MGDIEREIICWSLLVVEGLIPSEEFRLATLLVLKFTGTQFAILVQQYFAEVLFPQFQ